MRGNSVTEPTLDLALGNVISNPQFRSRSFQTSADLSIVGGRTNHALTHRDEPKSLSHGWNAAMAVVIGRQKFGLRHAALSTSSRIPLVD
jgi:hypothetical protein